ncbi:uncharacterized protein LOC102803933 [Saccoglossus kowalevskii]|uniref:Uncharacterized protein LOC102803933 n=1 Tax=Saccoglossus kowalevskii TaxID=10224 RepID=A0ABM0MI50_SACKO|nr:PREDICTED: uncharacterized protein LOC102803933 [Saccoglossus kowalevskii]
MSSIEEIKSSIQESLNSNMERNISKANLKAGDILNKADDLTNPRYWYQNEYPRQLVQILSRSSTFVGMPRNGVDVERAVFTADEQTLQHLRSLDQLDKELRNKYQSKLVENRQRHGDGAQRQGRRQHRGQLAWQRRHVAENRYDALIGRNNKALGGTIVTVNVLREEKEEPEESGDDFFKLTRETDYRAGEKIGGKNKALPTPEIERYRSIKRQDTNNQINNEDVLDAYNRKPSKKVDSLPSIHKSFLPREKRAYKQVVPTTHAPTDESHSQSFPRIEIDTRRSDDYETSEKKETSTKKAGNKTSGDKMPFPSIEDLMQVRELGKSDAMSMTDNEQKQRHYMDDWIHKLANEKSGSKQGRTRKKKFQDVFQKSFDPTIYKTDTKVHDIEVSKPKHILMKPNNALAPLPRKYPELATNEKPFGGMYFHTLRQKSVYHLKLNEMNVQLKQYKRKQPRSPSVSSTSSHNSDFHYKFNKVENKLDVIENQIGKLYHSNASLQRIVNRDASKSKTESVSNRDDLSIDAIPVSTRPPKIDSSFENNVTDSAKDVAEKVIARKSPGIEEEENGTEAGKDHCHSNEKEESAPEQEKNDSKYKYSKTGIVATENQDINKLNVVTLEMDGEENRAADIARKTQTISSASKPETHATDEDSGSTGSDVAYERISRETRRSVAGSPVKEPMKKFHKLEPFNEKDSLKHKASKMAQGNEDRLRDESCQQSNDFEETDKERFEAKDTDASSAGDSNEVDKDKIISKNKDIDTCSVGVTNEADKHKNDKHNTVDEDDEKPNDETTTAEKEKHEGENEDVIVAEPNKPRSPSINIGEDPVNDSASEKSGNRVVGAENTDNMPNCEDNKKGLTTEINADGASADDDDDDVIVDKTRENGVNISPRNVDSNDGGDTPVVEGADTNTDSKPGNKDSLTQLSKADETINVDNAGGVN